MKYLNYLTLFFAICIFACSPQQPTEEKKEPTPSASPDLEALKKILNDYYTTMSDRDWPQYKTFFSPDATLTTVWQGPTDTVPQINTNTISDFIAKTKDGPDSQPIFEEKMRSHEIKVKKNLATAWVSYEAKFGTEENLMEWTGMDLFSFMKYNGEWKIVALAFESD